MATKRKTADTADVKSPTADERAEASTYDTREESNVEIVTEGDDLNPNPIVRLEGKVDPNLRVTEDGSVLTSNDDQAAMESDES